MHSSHTPAEREPRVRALLDAARRRLSCKHEGVLHPLGIRGADGTSQICKCEDCDSHVLLDRLGCVTLVHRDAVVRAAAACSAKLARLQ